jgi:hypothetical protein
MAMNRQQLMQANLINKYVYQNNRLHKHKEMKGEKKKEGKRERKEKRCVWLCVYDVIYYLKHVFLIFRNR